MDGDEKSPVTQSDPPMDECASHGDNAPSNANTPDDHDKATNSDDELVKMYAEIANSDSELNKAEREEEVDKAKETEDSGIDENERDKKERGVYHL